MHCIYTHTSVAMQLYVGKTVCQYGCMLVAKMVYVCQYGHMFAVWFITYKIGVANLPL